LRPRRRLILKQSSGIEGLYPVASPGGWPGLRFFRRSARGLLHFRGAPKGDLSVNAVRGGSSYPVLACKTGGAVTDGLCVGPQAWRWPAPPPRSGVVPATRIVHSAWRTRIRFPLHSHGRTHVNRIVRLTGSWIISSCCYGSEAEPISNSSLSGSIQTHIRSPPRGGCTLIPHTAARLTWANSRQPDCAAYGLMDYLLVLLWIRG
jgi:hypothetical protein